MSPERFVKGESERTYLSHGPYTAVCAPSAQPPAIVAAILPASKIHALPGLPMRELRRLGLKQCRRMRITGSRSGSSFLIRASMVFLSEAFGLGLQMVGVQAGP